MEYIYILNYFFLNAYEYYFCNYMGFSEFPKEGIDQEVDLVQVATCVCTCLCTCLKTMEVAVMYLIDASAATPNTGISDTAQQRTVDLCNLSAKCCIRVEKAMVTLVSSTRESFPLYFNLGTCLQTAITETYL